jgi:putative ABC transport system ATP-binding protein
VAHWLYRYDGLNWNVAKAEARRALIEVGVDTEKWERNVDDLSGGEKAAVAVARAFARNRAICILDEIMAPLHEDVMGTLVELLRRRANQGAAVLVVLQHLHLVNEFDRKWTMANGRLVSDELVSRHRGAPIRRQGD